MRPEFGAVFLWSNFGFGFRLLDHYTVAEHHFELLGQQDSLMITKLKWFEFVWVVLCCVSALWVVSSVLVALGISKHLGFWLVLPLAPFIGVAFAKLIVWSRG